MRENTQPLASLWTCCEARWPQAVDDVVQSTRALEDARHVAIMPDVHLARGFCVGTVLATSQLIYPSAVGNDIGCGMLALAFNADAKAIDQTLATRLLALLPKLVPANRQNQPLLHLTTSRPRLSHPRLDHAVQQDGLAQLGTLGSGNHFLELQRDTADGRLWLMLHSGSRGLGQAISQHHTQQATHRSRGRPCLDAATAQGRAYLRDVSAARAYARLNRLCMARATVFALHELAGITADWSTAIHTDHNHVRRETVGDEPLWIHRKGAAPALAGQPSVIPGSMGSASFHVVGKGHAASLRSSSHGAGRRLDRTSAKRRITKQAVLRAMDGVWFNHKAAGRLTDEAPQAYKDIDQVIKRQREQIRVIRRLTPALNYKGT